MSVPGITIESIISEYPELELNLVTGNEGIVNRITSTEINRPGLTLTGFFDFFAHDRIQIFGKGEWSYITSLGAENLSALLKQFFSYSLSCIIFTHGNNPPQEFINKCEELKVPLLLTKTPTHRFITLISQILDKSLAPRTMRHGVLIEVFGLGILLTGKSGVGKSETALELIERGHRLVADDMVEIRRVSESYLVGTCSDLLRHHMEIRGLGIINVKDIFGIGSVRDHKILELIINLEDFSSNNDYDRTGMENRTEEILGVKVPKLTIPIKPGRNIPIIVETASMNQRLKKMGKNTATEFNNKLTSFIDNTKIETDKSTD